MMNYFKRVVILAGSFLLTSTLMAQNLLIMTQFTADPSVRVFNGKLYLYPSHDIVAKPGHGQAGWFCMADYHVYSSANLINWVDHGIVVSQNKVPWVNSTGYSMWAPDYIERAGKYYFYFPATVKNENGRNFGVGVAIADQPYGPFIPQPLPITGVHGIDPNVQIDKDGQAYIYWAQGNLYGARLKANMLELASEPLKLEGFPDKGLKEGPFLFERKGIYYMTYPHVANKTERLEYATSKSPLGPFNYGGVLMDESASGCWTNHQSVIEFKSQWYLFYHDDDLSPKFDKNRSVRADSLFFNDDGTIHKVVPTLRGVGITQATQKIQIDRYSALSNDDTKIEFLDTLDRFKGWKTIFSGVSAWLRYNKVDFGKKTTNYLLLNTRSVTGGVLLIRTGSMTGPVVAKVTIPKGSKWRLSGSALLNRPIGIKDLFISSPGGGQVEVDWLSFKSKH